MATLLAIVDPGRRGDRLRAVLRELRARRDPLRRHAALRAAARAGLAFDPDELAAAFSNQHARHHHQHAEQPDRQGVLARGAEIIARLCQQWDVLAITDEIYEHILYDGHRARAARDARRHGRAHGHDQRAVEDVQRDRLARRLGDLAARARGRRSARCTTSSPWARRRRCRRRARSRWRWTTATTRSWRRDYAGRRDRLLDVLDAQRLRRASGRPARTTS